MRAAALASTALLLLVVRTAVASSIQPIRGDQPLAPITYSVAPSVSGAAAATDGTSFFAVWKSVGLCASRIDHDGTPLDVPPRVVTSDDASLIGVTYAAGRYFVVWSAGNGLFFRRYATDGSPLDTEPRVVWRGGIYGVDVVTDGTRLGMVIGLQQSTALFVYDANGALMGGPYTILTNAVPVSAAAANARGIVMVRGDYGTSGQYAVVLGWDGQVIASRILPGGLQSGAIAAGADNFLFVDILSPAAVTIGLNGAIGTLLTLDTKGTFTKSSRVVWDGGSYVVAWQKTDGTRAVARVTAAGLLDGTPAAIPTAGAPLSLVATSGDHLLLSARSQTTPPSSWVEGTLFASPASIASEPPARQSFNITRAAAEQIGGATASTASHTLAVWNERTAVDAFRVRGAFIDAHGAGTPFDVASSANDLAPVVATNGRDFAVVWTTGTDVRARVVAGDGSGGAPLTLYSGAKAIRAMAVAWSGRAFVAAWTDLSERRVAALGSAPALVHGLESRQPYFEMLSIGCNASTCFFADAFDENAGSTPDGSAFVARITLAGTPASDFVQVAQTHGQGVGPPYVLATVSKPLVIYGVLGFLYAVPVDGGTVTQLWFNASTVVGVYTAPRVVGSRGDGIYWCDIAYADIATAQLHWSRVTFDPVLYLAGTLYLGDVAPLPSSASTTATTLDVVYPGGWRDPALLAQRLYLRSFTSPDPLPVVPRRRPTG